MRNFTHSRNLDPAAWWHGAGNQVAEQGRGNVGSNTRQRLIVSLGTAPDDDYLRSADRALQSPGGRAYRDCERKDYPITHGNHPSMRVVSRNDATYRLSSIRLINL